MSDPFASPRCSSVMAQPSRADINMSAKKDTLPRLIRQESFKRSRPDDATPLSIPPTVCSPMSTADDSPSVALGIAAFSEIRVDTQKTMLQPGLARKRFDSERILDETTRPKISVLEETQIMVAERIDVYLTCVHRGFVQPKPVFAAATPPNVLFSKYVQRIISLTNQYAEENEAPDSLGIRCAALALELIKRANLRLDGLSIHRCFLTAHLLGIKLLHDFYMSNSFWSQVGGVSLKEVNAMEIVFCEALRWDLRVNPEEHELSLRRLIKSPCC